MKQIIILSGPKRSGKDTVAKLITQQITSADQFAYADQLKIAASQLLNLIYQPQELFTPEHFNDEKLRSGPFPSTHRMEWDGKQVCLRAVMQQLGTDICRNCISKNIWINVVIEKIRESTAKVVIITDARFPNEITSIVEEFGETHQIHTILVSRASETNDDHASETQFAQMMQDRLFTGILDNSGSLDELKEQVTEFVQKKLMSGDDSDE